jgi:hypothetical protein
VVLAIATQLALVATDHVQSRVVVMASVPVPPSAVKLVGAEPTCTWHFTDAGAVTAVDVCEEVQPGPARVKATIRVNP